MQWSFSLNNVGVCLSLQSWRWCLRCCSVVVSSKGTYKVEQNYTPTHKNNPTKCPKFKCNTVSVSFSACRCNSVVLSSKVGRQRKKKRVWSQFWEWYLQLWLPCPLLSACCCWRHYLLDLRGELSTHLAPQALFTQSSPVCEPLLQAFPFPSTLGEVTLHPHSQACVFIYSSRGKWVFPLSCGVLVPPPLLQAFLLLIAGCVPPLLPSPAWLVRDFPFPPFSTQGDPPSLLCVFFVVVYYSVSLFSLGGGRSVQEAMLIWPRIVCGSTACRLAHLVVCIFLSHLVAAVWWRCGSPPLFLVLECFIYHSIYSLECFLVSVPSVTFMTVILPCVFIISLLYLLVLNLLAVLLLF
jgi:hypothetical protein